MRRLLCLAVLAVAGAPAFAAATVSVTVTNTGPNEHRVVLESLIPASPQAVWKALTDYDHQAEFMPYLSKSRVTQTSSVDLMVEQEGKIRVLFWTFVLRVKQQVTRSPLSEPTRFHAVDGDFQRLDGSWRIQPGPADRGGSRLEFHFVVQPVRRVPGWAVWFVAQRYLSRMVKSLGEHARSLPS
jgi:ribosome-associated toxin RatA of RatAB toxin-antitoxin module